MTERDAGAPSPALLSAAQAAWQPATILQVARLTPRVVSVLLRTRHWPPFLPGQHVDVRLTAADGYRAHRPYSIASAPGDQTALELVIERLDDGEVSAWFHEVAAPGDVVELRGPFAEHFVWRDDDAGTVLLAAGGSGVAPFLSMLRHRATRTAAPPLVLVYSARGWDEVIHRDELLEHERRQRDLKLLLCLTRDTARRPQDVSHRVDREVTERALAALRAPPAHVFVCGANRFVDAVSALLIDAGIAASTIRTERYGGR